MNDMSLQDALAVWNYIGAIRPCGDGGFSTGPRDANESEIVRKAHDVITEHAQAVIKRWQPSIFSDRARRDAERVT
jgi:hypothetical protein